MLFNALLFLCFSDSSRIDQAKVERNFLVNTKKNAFLAGIITADVFVVLSSYWRLEKQTSLLFLFTVAITF